MTAHRSELVLLAASPLLQVVHDLIFIPQPGDPAPVHKLLHVKNAFIQHGFNLHISSFTV